MIGLAVFAGLLLLGFTVGRSLESRHYQSIHRREHATTHQLVLTIREPPASGKVAATRLAVGSVVVSVDYFKRFLSGLRMFFGGELQSYASLIDRARREAVLRMKESAPDADVFFNTRLETSSISKGEDNKQIGCVEILAYGTAIRYEERP
jgi:uncharacterized protein YbjQ (UPF0145 family)